MSPVIQMKSLLTTFALTLLLIAATIKPAHAQNSPSLEVVTPTENQTVYGSKIPILFNVINFQLVEDTPGTKPQVGQGHILLWLDDQNPTTESATKVAADTFTYSDVAYGNHILVAELVASDNKPLIPSQKVTVNFASAAAPLTEDPKITSSFDKNTALVILVVVALVIVAAWWYTKDEDEETPNKKETKKVASGPKTKITRKTKSNSKKKRS